MMIAKLVKPQTFLSLAMFGQHNACLCRFSPSFTARQMSLASSNEDIIVDKRGEGGCVGVVTMNRPDVMNSFTNSYMGRLGKTMRNMDADSSVAAIVITGGEKVFSAGGDITVMQDMKFKDCYWSFMKNFDTVVNVRKPVIAAVNGFAVGGGCELALMCDIILAGEKAKFGIPDSKIGTVAGGGGTQRLSQVIGKSRAMQMCLHGDTVTAQQAEAWGLVSSVYPPDQVLNEAVKLGEKIAQHSKLIVAICKESINKSFDLSLSEGLQFERLLFYATFATNDCAEGIAAFVEKRKPVFTDS